MPIEPIPLGEIIAEMSEEDQAWVERQSAQWIAEERARRVGVRRARVAGGDEPQPSSAD